MGEDPGVILVAYNAEAMEKESSCVIVRVMIKSKSRKTLCVPKNHRKMNLHKKLNKSAHMSIDKSLQVIMDDLSAESTAFLFFYDGQWRSLSLYISRIPRRNVQTFPIRDNNQSFHETIRICVYIFSISKQYNATFPSRCVPPGRKPICEEF